MIPLVLAAAIAAAGDGKPKPDGGTKPLPSPVTAAHPLFVDSDHARVDGQKQETHWWGHVKVKRGTTNMSCDRMITHYNHNEDITRVECTGHVEVLDVNKWAKGEKADFDNIKGILIVTGNPEAMIGVNHVRGSKVTFLLDKDTVDIENATAVLKKAPDGLDDQPSEPERRADSKKEAKKDA